MQSFASRSIYTVCMRKKIKVAETFLCLWRGSRGQAKINDSAEMHLFPLLIGCCGPCGFVCSLIQDGLFPKNSCGSCTMCYNAYSSTIHDRHMERKVVQCEVKTICMWKHYYVSDIPSFRPLLLEDIYTSSDFQENFYAVCPQRPLENVGYGSASSATSETLCRRELLGSSR